MQKSIPRNNGFTLIELLITVAIVGILAAIAYPSYQNYVQKGRRVDAKNALMDAAQIMERYYTEKSTYVGASIGTTTSDIILPTSANGDYTLDWTTGEPTAGTWKIKAAPTSSRQSTDKCGTFTLDNTGQKEVTGGSLSSSSCW